MLLSCLHDRTSIFNNNVFSLVKGKEINKTCSCFGDVWGVYDKLVENIYQRTASCIILLLISHFRKLYKLHQVNKI